MSSDEIRACYRLYKAYYSSCGLSPYRRMLLSLRSLENAVAELRAELKTQE
jgi:hypothetical protein